MDLKTLSVTELKALAYDCLATMENIQKNLSAINQEIAKKMSEPKVSSTTMPFFKVEEKAND